MKKILIVITFTFFLLTSFISFAREIPYTQDDRDRLIRVEEGQKAINQRIDDLIKRIESLQNFMLWGFGIIFGGMGLLIGFVIWDRKTALQPVIRKNRELEEREEKIERALKELAKKDPNIAEILKKIGLF